MIDEKQVDALLVSGDIFDTTTPSNRSAELYYQFLTRLIKSCCRHVVITAGNHDSPSFLNAPKEILKELKVHLVTGVPGETVEDELILLKDEEGTVEMIVAAVPYLRESAIRTPALAESVEDKVRNLIAGLTQHYHQVAQLAISKREECGRDIPVVAMGHLFAVGGKQLKMTGCESSMSAILQRWGRIFFLQSSTMSPSVTFTSLNQWEEMRISAIADRPCRWDLES